MISKEDMYQLLDDASTCALHCLNEEQNKKHPSQGAINYLQGVYDRLLDVMQEYK